VFPYFISGLVNRRKASKVTLKRLLLFSDPGVIVAYFVSLGRVTHLGRVSKYVCTQPDTWFGCEMPPQWK
jgi:hypothetical protein